jgi:hypothetical protein
MNHALHLSHLHAAPMLYIVLLMQFSKPQHSSLRVAISGAACCQYMSAKLARPTCLLPCRHTSRKYQHQQW